MSLADVSPPNPHAFRVEYPGPGKPPVISFNGTDITDKVRAYEIHHEATSPIPDVVIVLHPRATAELLFDGLAHVWIGDPDPAGIVTYLEGLEAEDVERAALSRLDLGNGPGATTEAIIRQLIEGARGGA